MKELVRVIAVSLVDHPDEVVVTGEGDRELHYLRITCCSR